MNQQSLLAEHRSVLRLPSWLGGDVIEEYALPLEAGDYKVRPGARWTVTSRKTGETVYSGIGPVEIVRSSVPF